MNKKYISLVLAGLMCFSFITPAFAYGLDSNNNSIESVEYQNADDEGYINKTSVFAELGSEYKIIIPKIIVLSGIDKKADYYVKVEGDIAGYETVNVVPDETVNLYTKNKDSQVGTITQNKTTWKFDNFDTDANGTIQADDLTAGKWSGTFNFNINLTSKEVVDTIEVDGGTVTLSVMKNNSLLDQLVDEGFITNTSEVITLYDAKVSEGVKFPVTLEFDVNKEDGSKVAIYHFNGTNWELISFATVKNGKVSATFTSLSPIAIADVPEQSKEAGLYDENDNLIVSWDDMVSETGFNVSTNYTIRNYSISAFYSIMTKYPTVKKVVIPEGIEQIGDYALAYCSSLTSIEMPDSVSSVGDYALHGCTSLKSITIPNSITVIGQSAFFGTSLTSVTIPDSVGRIKGYVFYNCTSLTSITIPNSITVIEENAFYNCTSLTSITYNGTKEQWNAIGKGSNWKAYVPGDCLLHCIDGDTSI